MGQDICVLCDGPKHYEVLNQPGSGWHVATVCACTVIKVSKYYPKQSSAVQIKRYMERASYKPNYRSLKK